MHPLIFTLTGGLAAALVLGLVSQKLKLSPIVGYLLAGILVGPHTLGFVAHQDLAKEMAEIGVNGIEPVFIEMNVETVQKLRRGKRPVVHGDAGNRETLVAAGIEWSAILVLSATPEQSDRERHRIRRELSEIV